MRRVLVICLLIGVALTVSACGGKKSSQGVKLTPVRYVASAAKKTTELKSEHLEMTASTTVAGAKVSIAGSGDMQNKPVLGDIHASFSASGVNGAMDEVMNGLTVYLKSSLFGSLPQGKSWLKLDLQKFGTAKGINFSALMTQSPTQPLSRLEGAGDVTTVGSETVDGVATTHYRVDHIDISKLPQGAKVESFTHATYGPMDVWVGTADGYVHRMHMSYTVSISGQSASTDMTMTLSRFGEAVNVNVPSDSDAYDATSLAAKAKTP